MSALPELTLTITVPHGERLTVRFHAGALPLTDDRLALLAQLVEPDAWDRSVQPARTPWQEVREALREESADPATWDDVRTTIKESAAGGG